MDGNPIREIRLEQGDTLHSFSKKLGINYQTLYLNEVGCYPQILPQILDQLTHEGYSKKELQERYITYVKLRRQEFETKHSPYILPPVGELKIAPIIAWREFLGYTRSALCKALCVQPSQLQRLELNKTFHFFDQLEQAFRDINFPRNLQVELIYRTEEFFSRTH